jgi:simple sugar transport system permease protein
MIEDILLSSLRLSVPLIFAALGGLMSERSGIANIALECYLLISAFAGAAVVATTGNLWLGVACGLLASGLTGALFAATCIWGRGDQVVVGTAFNLLAAGIIPVLTKAFFDVTGSTPALPADLRFHEPWVFFALAVVAVAAFQFLFKSTRHGMRITAAGENPAALATQGVSFKLVRLRAVVEGSLVAGIGGVYLSLCQGSGYIREMSAGRGFIALAALIFGSWKPIPTFLACLFFSVTDAVQMRMQGQIIAGYAVPNQFVQIIPYLATLFVLIFYSRAITAPAAINREVQI